MLLGDMCIEPLELTVTQAAAGLSILRKTSSLPLNGHAGISPGRAVRFPPGVLAAPRLLSNLSHLRRAIGYV
jgi:plasmid maintenance system antidote protein VapI